MSNEILPSRSSDAGPIHQRGLCPVCCSPWATLTSCITCGDTVCNSCPGAVAIDDSIGIWKCARCAAIVAEPKRDWDDWLADAVQSISMARQVEGTAPDAETAKRRGVQYVSQHEMRKAHLEQAIGELREAIRAIPQ